MKIKCEKHLFVFYLIIIDLLFFPYLKPIKTSLSSIIVMFLILLNLKLLFFKKSYKYLLICLFSVFSLAISIIYYPNYFANNFSRLIILELFLLIFFIFLQSKEYLRKININELLFIYLCFNTFLAIIFYLDINQYFVIRSFWSLSDSINTNEVLSILTRFTGIISDPNNCACITIAIVSFIDKDYFNKSKTICIYLMMFFVVLMTMSVTGFICLLLFCIVRFNLFSSVNKVKIKYLFFFLLMIIIFFTTLKIFFNTEYGELFMQRIELNTHNTENGRIDIWIKIISNLNPLRFIVLGFGGNIFVDNLMINPHNGHLYLIYNFGLIVYVLFMYIFFKLKYIKKNKLLYLIFFINFSLNTVLIDYRCSMIYVILLAFNALNYEYDIKNRLV